MGQNGATCFIDQNGARSWDTPSPAANRLVWLTTRSGELYYSEAGHPCYLQVLLFCSSAAKSASKGRETIDA